MDSSRCGAPLTLPRTARIDGGPPHTEGRSLSTPAGGRASSPGPARWSSRSRAARGGCRGSPPRTVPRWRRSREPPRA